MKVERPFAKFNPVVITVETEQELAAVMQAVYEVRYHYYDTDLGKICEVLYAQLASVRVQS